jgi:hypothetical protein
MRTHRPRITAFPASASHTRMRALRALLLTLILALLCVVFGAPAGARPPTELDYSPEFDQGILGEGRQAYRERRSEERAWDSYRYFKQHSAENADDPVAAWHLAMSCYYLGIRVSKDSDEKKKLFDEGRRQAERGLQSDPECAPCHLLVAINGALWGKEVGIFRTVVGLPRVKHHLKRAAEINPRFGGGAPYRVQAFIYKALPRFLGGGRDLARKYIEKAIRVAPEEHLNYEFLAYLLARDYDDMEAGARVARAGLEIQPPGPEYVESVDAVTGLKRFMRYYTDWAQKQR